MPPSRRAVPVVVDRLRPVDHASLGEVVLVVRARDGDRRALEQLVRRHEAGVRSLCARLLRDPEDARDAAQESLAKLCGRLPQYRGEAAFATWLHRLVVNTCHDVAVRQARRRHEPLTAAAVARHAEPDEAGRVVEAADASTLRPALRRALRGLPEAQRRVVVLRDVLAWPYADIADALELPVGTVKCQAHRARRALHARLEAPLRALRRAG